MDTKGKSTSATRQGEFMPVKRFRTIMGRRLWLMVFVLSLGSISTFGQGVGISEESIVPHSSSILELRHESGPFKGLLIPRMTTADRVSIDISDSDPTGEPSGLIVYDTETLSFWYWDGFWRAMAASPFGDANQLLGMNAGGDANEYKTLFGVSNQVNVEHAAGVITLSTPQDIHLGASPTFVGLTLSGLTADAGVYTDGLHRLTSMPPNSGTIGYWSRSESTLSPSNAGDAITTTGNIYTTGSGTITSAGLLTGQSGLDITGGLLTVNDGTSDVFTVDNATGNTAISGTLGVGGTTTLDATDGLQFGAAGQNVTEFSTDATMADNSNTAVPTEAAVRGYVDTEVSGITLNSGSGITIDGSNNIDLGGLLDATANIVTGATENLQVSGTGILDVDVDAYFSGTTTLSTVDINGGNIDGTAIGSTSASSGSFTSLSASGASTLTGNVDAQGGIDITGGLLTVNDGTSDVFTVDNATGNTAISGTLGVGGTTTLDATDGLQFGAAGQNVTEFSTDATMADNSNTAVPTEAAVRGYVDTEVSGITLDALSPMTAAGDLIYGGAGGTGTRLADGTSGQVLTTDGGGSLSWETPTVGTVTSISVVAANGLNGSVANATTTPAITLSTNVTGILKGDGTAISAATPRTDYENPLTFANGLTRGVSDDISLGGTLTGNTSIDNSTYSMTIGGSTATGAITVGSSINAQPVNIGTGSGANDVNIATGGTGTVTIGNSSSTASTTNINSTTTTIGIAGTTNGDGLRIGNGRVTVNKPTAPSTLATGNKLATVSEILDAGIIGFNVSGGPALTLTLPSARGAGGLVQALPGTPAVGDVFTFKVFNIADIAITLVAGTGITIENTGNINGQVIYCRVTSVTPGTETISVY
jgi:hypothetical protein